MNDDAKPNILLVDDRADQLLALETILGDLPVRIVTARSGKEALKQLLLEEFALIIFDVQMPEMTGLETAALMRQRARFQDTPVIFVSAYERDSIQVKEAYALGAVDYISTPESAEILRAKVGSCVARHQKEREQLQKHRELQTRLEETEAACGQLQQMLEEARALVRDWQERAGEHERAFRQTQAVVEQSAAALDQARQGQRETETRLEEAETALSRSEALAAQWQERHQQAETALRQVQAELAESKGLEAHWRQLQEQSASELAQLRLSLTQWTAESNRWQERAGELEKALEGAREEIDQLRNTLAEATQRQAQTEARLETATVSWERAERQARDAEKRNSELQSQLAESGALCAKTRGQLALREQELSEAHKQGSDLATQLEKTQRLLAQEQELRAQRERELRAGQESARRQEELSKAYFADLHRACDLLSVDVAQQLRGLQSFAQLLKTAYSHQLEADGADCIRRMNSAVDRLEVLRADLVSVFGETAPALKIQPTDLEKTIQEALRPFAGEIRKRKGTLAVPSSLPRISTHGPSLQLVIHDLVELALATLEQDKPPELSFSAEEAPGLIRLWFRDNSPALEAGMLGPFMEGEESEGKPGPAGVPVPALLSLRLSRLAGHLSWRPGEVGGNEFCFELPVTEIAEPVPVATEGNSQVDSG